MSSDGPVYLLTAMYWPVQAVGGRTQMLGAGHMRLNFVLARDADRWTP